MRHFVLIGDWLYVRNLQVYREFLKLGCRVVLVGCSSGHYHGCKGGK